LLRRYLKFAVPILLICVVLSLAARMLGSMQPPNPALNGLTEACVGIQQPCWFGVIPGVTTVAETHRTLLDLGYSPSQRSSFGIITYGRQAEVIPCRIQVRYVDSTGPIIALHFQECDGLQLGDFINALGFPDTLVIGTENHAVRYQPGLEIIVAGARFSPYRTVTNVELLPTLAVRSTIGVSWRGFRLRAHYCNDPLYGSVCPP
jgi:hypothetical protein